MGLGLEIFETSFLEGFWGDFWAFAWKSLKVPGSVLERLLGLGLEILENSFLESFGHDFYACRFRFLKDVLTKITTFGLAADRFLDLFWVRFLIDFGYRLRSPLGGLDEIRVAFWSDLKVVFL